MSDLLLFSRIDAAASGSGATVTRFEDPADVAPDVDLVLVDWAASGPGWAQALRRLDGPRIVLFGPHTDLEAHASARAAGLGPMWARSKLVVALPELMARGPSE